MGIYGLSHLSMYTIHMSSQCTLCTLYICPLSANFEEYIFPQISHFKTCFSARWLRYSSWVLNDAWQLLHKNLNTECERTCSLCRSNVLNTLEHIAQRYDLVISVSVIWRSLSVRITAGKFWAVLLLTAGKFWTTLLLAAGEFWIRLLLTWQTAEKGKYFRPLSCCT